MSTWEAATVGFFVGLIASSGTCWLGGWLYDRTHRNDPAPRPSRES